MKLFRGVYLQRNPKKNKNLYKEKRKMKKITKTVVSMLSALTVCSGVVGTTVLALPTPETTVKAATTPTTASSVLRYDESLFTVTEDQSAYVTPSVYTTTDANAKKNGKCTAFLRGYHGATPKRRLLTGQAISVYLFLSWCLC